MSLNLPTLQDASLRPEPRGVHGTIKISPDLTLEGVVNLVNKMIQDSAKEVDSRIRYNVLLNNLDIYTYDWNGETYVSFEVL